VSWIICSSVFFYAFSMDKACCLMNKIYFIYLGPHKIYRCKLFKYTKNANFYTCCDWTFQEILGMVKLPSDERVVVVALGKYTCASLCSALLHLWLILFTKWCSVTPLSASTAVLWRHCLLSSAVLWHHCLLSCYIIVWFLALFPEVTVCFLLLYCDVIVCFFLLYGVSLFAFFCCTVMSLFTFFCCTVLSLFAFFCCTIMPLFAFFCCTTIMSLFAFFCISVALWISFSQSSIMLLSSAVLWRHC
jgi:hypothetical protein